MKPIRTAILTASYACLAFLHVSCVREDTGDCMQYEIHVRVVDAAGNDLTQSGVLEKSEVYLFGENGFVRMVPAGVSSDYLFGNYKEARLTLVAWGNIKEDTLITADIKPGTPIEEARLKLKQHAEGSHLPVTDLFYCRKELNNTATRSIQEESITLVMERMAAGLSIRTCYLAERYPYRGEAYTFIVQTAYRHGRARRCLCPTLPHISDPGRRIHRSGNIQGAGKAVHRYARQRATALARSGRETDRHRDRFQKDRDKGIRKSTAVGRSGTGNGNVS